MQKIVVILVVVVLVICVALFVLSRARQGDADSSGRTRLVADPTTASQQPAGGERASRPPAAPKTEASSAANPDPQTAPPAAPTPTVMTEHPALRTLIDKSLSQRFGGDFEALVPTISDPTDIAWVVYILRDHTDLDAVRNEAANLLRRSHVPEVDRHLLDVLGSPFEKERFQSYAVQHLGDMRREFLNGTKPDDASRARVIRDALITSLKSPHFMVRCEALMALARERDPRATEIIRQGLNDPQWATGQDLLIRCAKEAGMTDLVPTIRPLAYSTNEIVRIAAVNVLAEWRDEASRPAFEEASRSTVPRLQRAGKLALSLLEQP